MNMLLYDIKEGKEKIDVTKSINIIATSIYRKYRQENWHLNILRKYINNYIPNQEIAMDNGLRTTTNKEKSSLKV